VLRSGCPVISVLVSCHYWLLALRLAYSTRLDLSPGDTEAMEQEWIFRSSTSAHPVAEGAPDPPLRPELLSPS
jgi:hypothetical protein